MDRIGSGKASRTSNGVPLDPTSSHQTLVSLHPPASAPFAPSPLSFATAPLELTATAPVPLTRKQAISTALKGIDSLKRSRLGVIGLKGSLAIGQVSALVTLLILSGRRAGTTEGGSFEDQSVAIPAVDLVRPHQTCKDQPLDKWMIASVVRLSVCWGLSLYTVARVEIFRARRSQRRRRGSGPGGSLQDPLRGSDDSATARKDHRGGRTGRRFFGKPTGPHPSTRVTGLETQARPEDMRSRSREGSNDPLLSPITSPLHSPTRTPCPQTPTQARTRDRSHDPLLPAASSSTTMTSSPSPPVSSSPPLHALPVERYPLARARSDSFTISDASERAKSSADPTAHDKSARAEKHAGRGIAGPGLAELVPSGGDQIREMIELSPASSPWAVNKGARDAERGVPEDASSHLQQQQGEDEEASEDGMVGRAEKAFRRLDSLAPKMTVLLFLMSVALFIYGNYILFATISTCRISTPLLWWGVATVVGVGYFLLLEVAVVVLGVGVIGPSVLTLLRAIRVLEPLPLPALPFPPPPPPMRVEEISKLPIVCYVALRSPPDTFDKDIPMATTDFANPLRSGFPACLRMNRSESSDSKVSSYASSCSEEAHGVRPEHLVPSLSKVEMRSDTSSRSPTESRKDDRRARKIETPSRTSEVQTQSSQVIPQPEYQDKRFAYPPVSLPANLASCTICLADFVEARPSTNERVALGGAGRQDEEEGDALRILGCGHVFHQDCIDHWLGKISGRCPVCAKAVAV